MSGWVAVAKAAVDFGKTFYAASAAREEARIRNYTARENAKAANVVRQGNNLASSASANFARVVQSINNNRALTATGNAVEMSYVNALRQEDANKTQSFEQQLQTAEQEGAAAAAAGFSGASGSVVDNVNSATALRNARAEAAVGKAQDQTEYDLARRTASLWEQGVSGLSVDTFYNRIDNSKNVAVQEREQNPWEVALRKTAATLAGNAISAYTPSPQTAASTAASNRTALNASNYAADPGYYGTPAPVPTAPSGFSLDSILSMFK